MQLDTLNACSSERVDNIASRSTGKKLKSLKIFRRSVKTPKSNVLVKKTSFLQGTQR